jgi:Zn-dependent proteases
VVCVASSIKIGRIKGIDIELNYNWIVIFLLITYMFANYYFPTYFKDWPQWVYWAEGAFIGIMLFVSVLLHELSHSLVSKHFGIAVNKISLFIFGGMAYIEKDADTPGKEFLIAIAGPLMSLFLSIIFTVTSNVLALSGASEIISAPLAYIGQMNIVLAVFNLFPAMPLDGGRILTAAIWKIKKTESTPPR